MRVTVAYMRLFGQIVLATVVMGAGPAAVILLVGWVLSL